MIIERPTVNDIKQAIPWFQSADNDIWTRV